MGIIVSSFLGCGREYLKNTHGDKIKIYDAVSEFPIKESDGTIRQDKADGYFNKVMDYVGDNDIVFIGSDKPILDVFDKNNVDYDVFYPSVERKNEFIENQVRKRAPHNIIRDMDMHFNEWIDDIDGNNSPNCYKHKMNNKGEYIGNMPLIMQYIDTLKNQPKQTN